MFEGLTDVKTKGFLKLPHIDVTVILRKKGVSTVVRHILVYVYVKEVYNVWYLSAHCMRKLIRITLDLQSTPLNLNTKYA